MSAPHRPGSKPLRGRRPRWRGPVTGSLLLALLSWGAPPAALAQTEAAESLATAAARRAKRHRVRQDRPIRMGTSGGNVADFTTDPPSITCCSGTLGALLTKAAEPGRYFVLGNNHVLARLNHADPGEAISQPGRIDNSCQAPGDDSVAELTGFKRLKLEQGTNTVDAAIAAALPGMVDERGTILGVGVPGSGVAAPRVGMAVQKSGRTTGLTRGFVFAVNARVDVRYPDYCAEDAPYRVATFVKQVIIVSSEDTLFAAAGDSGAPVLEDGGRCPNFVGLFFASNSAVAIANKMSAVLKAANRMHPKGPAELVGCEQAAATAGATSPGGAPELSERELRWARRVQARADADLVALDGVHAIGIGRSTSRPELPSFKVFADTTKVGVLDRIPEQIDGVPVDVVHSGPIYARGGMSCSIEAD